MKKVTTDQDKIGLLGNGVETMPMSILKSLCSVRFHRQMCGMFCRGEYRRYGGILSL